MSSRKGTQAIKVLLNSGWIAMDKTNIFQDVILMLFFYGSY